MATTHPIDQASLLERHLKTDVSAAVPEAQEPPLGSAKRVLAFEPVRLRPGSPLASDIIIAERGEW